MINLRSEAPLLLNYLLPVRVCIGPVSEIPVIRRISILFILEPFGVVLELQKKNHAIMSEYKIENQEESDNRRTRSLPLIPLLFPALLWSSFVFLDASCSASFLSIRVFYHLAKDSGVTGVRLELSLCLCASPSLYSCEERELKQNIANLDFQKFFQTDNICFSCLSSGT
jgi:hypothetical protein